MTIFFNTAVVKVRTVRVKVVVVGFAFIYVIINRVLARTHFVITKALIAACLVLSDFINHTIFYARQEERINAVVASERASHQRDVN